MSRSDWRGADVLRPLDVRFADAVTRLAGEDGDLIWLGAAAASAALSHGHTCLELARVADLLAGREDDDSAGVTIVWPAAAPWRAALAASALVGDGSGPQPLVLEGERLYLNRYWDYQRRLAGELRRRAARTVSAKDAAATEAALGTLFPAKGSDPQQRQAAHTATQGALTLVSGGPGTGKTSTVVKILAALLAGNPRLRVALVAPTGKAAARMTESIRAAKAGDELAGLGAALRGAIPEAASTIHRRLGWQPFATSRFRHDVANPLPVDVVVLDEASMIDLALMTKLVEAIPEHARVVILGDKDQLASVQAGRVYGDLCAAAGAGMLGDRYVELVTSHRFGPDSGIAALAQAIKRGDADAAFDHFLTRDDLALMSPDPEAVREALVAGWRPAVAASSPGAALSAQGGFRVLCAHRRGPWGAEELNSRAREWLSAASAIAPGFRTHYRGLPVLVRRNDRTWGLANGDVGVVWPADASQGEGEGLRVWFPRGGDEPRSLSTAQLPEHEPCYAMTIHKAQGSGFREVLVVLPETASPILTRELLYTAVTRARERVTVVANPEVLRQAVISRVVRASGLQVALRRSSP